MKKQAKKDRFLDQWAETMDAINTLDSGKYHSLSSEYRLLHADTLTKLADMLQQTEALGIFTNADSVDDLTTIQLKYLNLNYYIAVLLEKTPIDMTSTAVDARISVAQLAVRKYVEFSVQLRDLHMLDESLYRRLDFVSDQSIKEPLDMGKLIDKLMEAKIKATSASRISKAKAHFEKCKDSIDSFDDNDNEVRETEKARISYHFVLAWKSISSLIDEIMLLGKMANFFKDTPLHERSAPYIPSAYLADFVRSKMSGKGMTFSELSEKTDSRVRQKETQRDMSTRVEQEPSLNTQQGKLVDGSGKVLRPFTILPSSSMNAADQARRSVFGTGQKLPTITLDQLVEKELANQAKPSVTKADLEELQNEDNDEYEDALTMKARNWDDFVDSTPKGSGNTMNMG